MYQIWDLAPGCKIRSKPGPLHVPEMSASPVNRLVFGIRTSFSWLVLFFGPREQKRPQRPAKRAQTLANEGKLEKINLGHCFIARAEIEESSTNCTFEQQHKASKQSINGRSRHLPKPT